MNCPQSAFAGPCAPSPLVRTTSPAMCPRRPARLPRCYRPTAMADISKPRPGVGGPKRGPEFGAADKVGGVAVITKPEVKRSAVLRTAPALCVTGGPSPHRFRHRGRLSSCCSMQSVTFSSPIGGLCSAAIRFPRPFRHPHPLWARMAAASPSKAPEGSRRSAVETYDVVVIGGGPAGLSLASGLGRRGVRVLCADNNLDKPWPNNYGTWVDELEPLGLADCTSHVWSRAAAFVHADGRKSELDRQYARVDVHAMKKRFLDRCEQSGSVSVVKAVANEVDVSSNSDATLVSLDMSSPTDQTQETKIVSARVVVDATGHSLKFVKFNEGKTPGFQAAYGIECVVSEKGFSYDNDEMTLMDFRDDHMQGTTEDRHVSSSRPTFIYVMPLDNDVGRRFFFEETSLVASPAMGFDELKERLYRRLAFYNIEVDEVCEEEFCLIPMGGEMPLLRQRVVAFGGSAALVHPATGYMIARALELADKAAEIIAGEIQGSGDADETAHRIWDRIWNMGRRRQRDFFNFGGEYLQKIDLQTTRDFFAAFFQLPKDQWSAFLSFRLMKPLDRLTFGLGVFVLVSNRVRTSITFDAITRGGIPLLMSILPVYHVDDKQ